MGAEKTFQAGSITKKILFNLLLAAVYFAVGKAGLSLAYVNPSATPVWPPTGLSLAVLLVWGYRMWPGIALGAFVVNLFTAGTILTSFGIAAGNTLEAITGAFLIRRFAGGDEVFYFPRNVFRFALLAAAGPLISAGLGGASLYAASFIPTEVLLPTLLTWGLGNYLSALVITPFLIIWKKELSFEWQKRSLFEIIAIILTTVVINKVTFGDWFHAGIDNFPIAYLGILPLLWSTFRFGLRGATGIVLLSFLFAIYGTMHGHSPFLAPPLSQNTSLLLLQAYLATLSLTGLVLGSVLLERQRAHEERSHFVSTVSHELRTPLTAIMQSVEIVSEEIAGQINKEQKEFLNAAYKNAERLMRLINNILNFQHLSAKKAVLDLKSCNIREIFDEVHRTVKPALEAKSFPLHIEVQPDLLPVPLDADRMMQVLLNLVDNAVKYGDKEIILSAGRGDGFLLISVEDKGSGIPAADLPKLFKPFSRIMKDKNKKGGTGLGLAISKQIVEQHGGKLWVESGLGEGTRFFISLPLK